VSRLLDTRHGEPPGSDAGHADERTEILTAIFAETLGVADVRPDQSFFALGGHSLLATRLIARIRTRLGADVALSTVLEHPTATGLSALLDGEATITARPPLRPRARPPELPLAPAQQRLWFLNRVADAGGTYNMPIAYRIRGPLDAAAMERAIDDLVARHEILRTAFPDWDGHPQQVVLSAAEAVVGLPVVDVAEADAEALLQREARAPFDLTQETPVRATLYRLEPHEHVLLLVVHHIACDGWSLVPLTRDLAAYYAARIGRGAPELPELEVQYADYALWQRELLADSDAESSLIRRETAFWKAALEDAPEIGLLRGMRPRPESPSYKGRDLETRIPADVHRALLALAASSRCTPFMIVHAALVIVLSAHGAGEDVAIGTPVAARTDSALDELVGFFVNTVVLRVSCGGDPTVEELLTRLRATDLAAFAHQDLPFDQLVRIVNAPRNGGWQPLFTVMLAFQNFGAAHLDLVDAQTEVVPLPSSVARFDLRFELVEEFSDERDPLGIALTLTWSLDVGTEQLAQALLDDLGETLRAITERPASRISHLHEKAAPAAAVAPPVRTVRLRDAPIAFVCSPFGQQWVGMARTMLSEEPVFRIVLEEIEHELARHADWSLIAELQRGEAESRLGEVSVMQPVVFAIQVGLCRWLESEDVRPSAVIGHSLGEISACVIAGMLDVPDAARLVIAYSAEQQRVAGRGGGMLVAEWSFGEMDAYLRRHGESVTIACSNGPRTTVVAGPAVELEAILGDLRARDILCAMIRVDLAAHTPAVDEILPDLIRRTRGISARPGRVQMISTVTARRLSWRDVGPEYFAANLRQQVRLAEANRMLLCEWGIAALVEISANPILEPALRQSAEDAGTGAVVLTTMRRSDANDRAGPLQAVRAVARDEAHAS